MIDIQRVRQVLDDSRIEYYESVPSTQAIAVQRAEAGATSGTAIVAGEQTAGIGRQGHSWHSEADTGLYVSIVLHPPMEPATRPVLTLALGLAAAEAIQRMTGADCDLRWPNDVIMNDRKAAGILVQLAANAAVAGIGINVNHGSFPPDIANHATSLRLATGRTQDPTELLIALLQSIAIWDRKLNDSGKRAIIDAFTRVSTYAQGKHVHVDMGDRQLEGITAGLDDYGFLRVRKPDGSIETVLAGGVRPAAGSHV
jgi:BirA family biotin operon repressor/biotin-[acetyl-CoA-carboxylase] ligase